MAKRLFNKRGMVSLNHNFSISERQIFLRSALDSSGKTGGGLFADCPSGKTGVATCKIPAQYPTQTIPGRAAMIDNRTAPYAALVARLALSFFFFAYLIRKIALIGFVPSALTMRLYSAYI
jgi:hypothetical protein